jgi:hypothetical protein
MEKSSIRKIFIVSFGHLLVVSNCSHCLPNFVAGIVDTGGKFATGINNSSETGGKFSASVVNTGGKFAAAIGGAP